MKCKLNYFFTVISNQTRWKIINSLYEGDKFVLEICEDIKEEQSKVSHNLRVLLGCKVVFSKKQGKFVKYSLNKKTMKPLIKILKKHMQEFCEGNCEKNLYAPAKKTKVFKPWMN